MTQIRNGCKYGTHYTVHTLGSQLVLLGFIDGSASLNYELDMFRSDINLSNLDDLYF